MAAQETRPPIRRAKSKVPVAGLILGLSGLVILGASVALVVRSRFGPPLEAPIPMVQNPLPPLPIDALPAPVVEKPWWDGMTEAHLGSTVAQLRKAFPHEKPLFDRLSAKADVVRLDAYYELLRKLPAWSRNANAKPLLGQFLIDCYALEPTERNVTPIRGWFVEQIPVMNQPFPPGDKKDDLERSLWALDISIEALKDKATRLDRVRNLAQDLGKAFGFAIDPDLPRTDLKTHAEKLLALRCYRNLIPTSEKSIADALALRDKLIRMFPQYLSSRFRDKVDIEMAFHAFPGALKSWPAYGRLLHDCLASEDPEVDLAVLHLYANADGELAAKMEPLLAVKWKAVRDSALTQAAKVKAVQRALGIPDPTDRRTILEKLACETLIVAHSPAQEKNAVLQETVRLAHASTLACALSQKEKGTAAFDELIARIPEIDQEEPKAVEAKDPKQPVDPAPGDKPGEVVKGNMRIITDKLPPGVASKVHSLLMKRGKRYSIDMISAFDNYLRLSSSNGKKLAEDDDSGGGLNARLLFAPTFDDTYRITATSPTGKGSGAYTLIVQEQAGFVGPGFGPFGPFGPPGPFPFPRPLGGRIPPFGLWPPFPSPPLPPLNIVPAQPVHPGPADPIGDGPAPLVDDADLVNLEKNYAKARMTAFQNTAAKLKDLAHKDLTARQARIIAKYLVTILDKDELGEAVAKLTPLTQSRSVMLALADIIDQDQAVQKSSEAVVGALLDVPLQFGKEDNWRLACRKLLLLQAFDLSRRKKSAAAEAAEIIRDRYAAQGILFGMKASDFTAMPLPSQTLESVIKHLADRVGQNNPEKAAQEYLAELPRRLRAVQFAAPNDLEHTVLLQRIWIRVLAIHLEQENPPRAKELRKAQDDLFEQDRRAVNILEQLRAGEKQILRQWCVALELK